MRKKTERRINKLIDDKLRKLEVLTFKDDSSWRFYKTMPLRDFVPMLLEYLGVEIIKRSSVEFMRKKKSKRRNNEQEKIK